MSSEETSENSQPEGEADHTADMVSLAEMLEQPTEQEPPEGDSGNVGQSGDGQEKPDLTKFNDLAEASGLELDDLYSLTITTTDGKDVSIQDLKALQTKQDEMVLSELEFAETKATKEAEIRTAQNELAEIVESLPKNSVTPQILEKIRARTTERVRTEQVKTLGEIPTWKDDETRTADLTGMAEHLERFGFAADHLASVVDHRMFVFVRESYLREKRIKTALERVKVGRPNPTTQTRKIGKSTGSAKPKNHDARNGLERFFTDA